MEKLLDKAENSSFDSGIRERALDSVYNELSDNKNDTLTRYYYRRATVAYYNLYLYDKSLAASKRTLKLALEEKDTLTMAKALHFAGVSFFQKSSIDSAFTYYSQAEKLYRDLDDKNSLGEIILYKAYVYYNIGEYVKCESEAIKALRLLEEENRINDIYSCYNLVATAMDGQNNNEEAIKYYNLALKQLDKFSGAGYSEEDIAYYRSSCYNNMGLVYVKMGNYQRAIKYYLEALEYDNLYASSPSLYAKLLNNLASARFKAGNFYGLPELFFQSLRIRDSLDNTSGIIASNINLGEYYAYQKDTATAIKYLKSAYKDASRIKSHYDILSSLEQLSVIDKDNSVYYLNRYKVVNDSLQEESKNNRDKFARIEYETDKLQDEKEALVKRNSFIIGVSAVLLLLIAAIFIIYYLNSRNKELLLIQEQQKANEEIYQLMFDQQSKVDAARKEEKNRIAMELHDGILNNIYAVRLNLEFINKKADEESVAKRKEYIKELQKVEAEIRGVSHDLSRSDIFQRDKSFSNLLEFMVTSQKNTFGTIFECEIDPSIDWEQESNVVKVNVYRIVQEALQNINKYSKAKHAGVNVSREGQTIKITVTDDGVGFDVDRAKGGIGLKNLKKRATTLNGDITITSTKGGGTNIEVVFREQHNA